MGSINSIVESEQKLQDIIDERLEDLDIWLRRLDKSRARVLPRYLYDAIKEFVEQSFIFDYSNIRSQEFYDQLKPKIRQKLTLELFNAFNKNFHYMFDDDDFGFGAGKEFICDFMSNLYSRIYLPTEDDYDAVIQYGETFPELYMIQEGIVNIALKGIGKENIFMVLPTNSYFGDFQILFDLKSQFVYRCESGRNLTCLCLKKNKLKEFMDDYPDARVFYKERAWLRRIEFRRRMKKHHQKLAKKTQMSNVWLQHSKTMLPQKQSKKDGVPGHSSAADHHHDNKEAQQNGNIDAHQKPADLNQAYISEFDGDLKKDPAPTTSGPPPTSPLEKTKTKKEGSTDAIKKDTSDGSKPDENGSSHSSFEKSQDSEEGEDEFDEDEFSSHSKDDSFSSDDDDDEDEESCVETKEIKAQHQQDKFMSRFYFKVNWQEEFTNDITVEELERFSEDELTESREEILKERNKKKAQQNADNIQKQMNKMSQAFGQMNTSLGKNLDVVNKHIQNLLDGNSTEDQEPQLESLSGILNALSIQLQQRIENMVIKQQAEAQKLQQTANIQGTNTHLLINEDKPLQGKPAQPDVDLAKEEEPLKNNNQQQA